MEARGRGSLVLLTHLGGKGEALSHRCISTKGINREGEGS